MSPPAYEQIIASSKTTLDVLGCMLRTTLEGSEHLISLNLNSAHMLVEGAAAHQRSLADVRDMDDVLSLTRACRRPLLEKFLSYSRSLYEIGAHIQEQLIKLAEARQAEIGASLSPVLEQIRRASPAGLGLGQAAAKCVVCAADSTLQAANRNARQWAEATEACVAATAGAVTRAVRAAA